MSLSIAVFVLFVMAVVAANIPFLSNRYFLVFELKVEKKSAWLRLLEWLVLYGVIVFLALGLERNVNGTIHSQSWEFWPVTLLLFVVFAMPGFVWQFDMRHYFVRYMKHKRQYEKQQAE